MKTNLLLTCLLVAVTACKSSTTTSPTPTDDFLGHWEAEKLRTVVYDVSTNKVNSDQTTTANSKLDITATTITFTSVVNGRTSTEVDTYTRNGEQLTLVPPSGNTGGETYFARNLTSTNFTFEFNGPKGGTRTTYYIQSIPYHR